MKRFIVLLFMIATVTVGTSCGTHSYDGTYNSAGSGIGTPDSGGGSGGG